MKKIVLLSLSFIFINLNCMAFVESKPKNFTEVAKKSIPAVVSIRVKAPVKKGWQNQNDPLNDEVWQYFFGIPRQPSPQNPTPEMGQASGFIISPDGYILTNNHVVRDADEIIVTLSDDKEFKGKVVGQDPQTDLAVIKIDGQNLNFLKLGNSDELEIAQPVMAIGAPLGLQASVTVGIVSAKGRNNLDLLKFEDFIQTDAAINRGNSGGPLLNEEGEVVGINTAIVSSNVGGGYMGIGFAIPSNIAQHVMDQLISTGGVTRGFMGVTLQQVDSDLAKAFGQEKPEGALIADVSKGSPAEKAGLKQGDIIVKYNNSKAANITALRNAIALMKPGTKINLTVLRSGKTLNIPIEIGIFPTAQTYVANRENKLGFEVENLSPEIARNLGLVNEQGVVISKVEQGSPAAWAGIRKGALLIAINHKKVQSIEDVNEALSKAESEKPVLLLVKQGEATRFVSLKVN